MRTNQLLAGLAATSLALVLSIGASAQQSPSTSTSGSQQGNTDTRTNPGNRSGSQGNMGNQGGTGSQSNRGTMSDSKSGNMSGNASGSMAGNSGSMAMLSSMEKKYVMESAQTNMAEVQTGNMAAQKGSSEEVKNLGRMLAEEHGKAQEELTQMASSKGITLPADVGPKHKAMAAKLERLDGMAFDKEFLKGQSAAHDKAVADTRKASQSAKDPDVKAYAAKQLPGIEGHTRTIKDMNAKMSGSGARMSSDSSRQQ